MMKPILTLFLVFVLLAGCANPPAATQEEPGAVDFVVPPATSSSSSSTSPPMPAASDDNETLPPEEKWTPNRTTNATKPAPVPSNSSEPHGEPRDWGSFEGKTIRPGIAVKGNYCTSNFMFQSNWTRFFIGSAGHCFSTTPNGGENCNASSWERIGSPVILDTRKGGTATGKLAYVSQVAMLELGETDAGPCQNNDFALIEIPQELLADAHPAVLYYGGPTALDEHSLTLNDDVYFIGHSGIRSGSYPVGVTAVYSEALSPVHLNFDGYTYDGWNFEWRGGAQHAMSLEFTDDPYKLNEPIPGDSGGPFLGPTGNALAMLGGGARNLEYALEWMEENWPWHVELVTWHEFSPDGIEPLQNGPV